MESPLNTAHQHVQNAEDYEAQGLLIPASEEHYKAAEAFQVSLGQATDDNHKHTMRLLYDKHNKLGKDLQRKIEKLRSENKDPALPQKAMQPRTPTAVYPGTGTYSPRAMPSPPPHGRGRMMDSQATVDESYMYLGARSDPGDEFGAFWTAMQTAQDILEQPLAVAFATAPLGPVERRDGSSSSENTDLEEPMASKFARKIGMGKSSRSRIFGSTMNMLPGSSKPPPVDLGDGFDENEFAGDNEDLSESFYVIPGGGSDLSLKKENGLLKDKVDVLQARLAQAEKVLQLRREQDTVLRDSIVMARHQAQRAMGASMLGGPQQRQGQAPMDFSALNINKTPVLPPVGPSRDREVTQLLGRVRELEEVVRNMKSESEKQKLMIAKFRERWEKLKESAKRKKEAKAAAEATKSGVTQRIDEEPEAEAEEAV